MTKILYALQGTGNGHIARAQEVIPILKKYAEVKVLISGHQSQLTLDENADFSFEGISLLYDKSGSLSYFKTVFHNNYPKAIKTAKNFDLNAYDLIINDFEPITAWAAKWQNKPCIGLGHQAALSFNETPKPQKKSWLGEKIIENYAPSSEKLGFHFENYNKKIHKPVIRKKIRNLNPEDKGYFVVYLPSYSDEKIIQKLRKIDVQWKVFSRYAKTSYRYENIEINPIDQKKYLNAFEDCTGILCNAGFETPAEALYLGKKLFVIPIGGQYEQECNAIALKSLGVATSHKLKEKKIESWVYRPQIINVDYPDQLEEILIKNVLGLI